MNFKRPRRREVERIQLTPLIDVFTLLIIFLIVGTVFAKSDIVIPKGLGLPLSMSKEGMDSAPRLVIQEDEVLLSFLNDKKVRLDVFRGHGAETEGLGQEVSRYVQELKPQAKSSGVLVNLVCDRATPYKDVYAVVEKLRIWGIESVLFVAEGAL